MKDRSEPIDEFETGWMQDIEEDSLKSDPETTKRLSGQLIVDQKLKKSHPLSIRIPDADIEAIQLRAAKEGIPYQTLIKSVLHKYATGQMEAS